jgi:hypothetical protein
LLDELRIVAGENAGGGNAGLCHTRKFEN